MKYLEVAVSLPVGRTLTYGPPEDLTVKLVPGLRLLVPLAGRMVTGYLLGPAPEPPAAVQISPVAEILDEAPLFPADLVPFFRWISQYYQHPLGEVLKAALPGGLEKKSRRRINLTDKGRSYFSGLDSEQLSAWQSSCPWLERLLAEETLPGAVTRQVLGGRDRRLVEKWTASGWLAVVSELVGGNLKVKDEICVGLAEKWKAAERLNEYPAELKVAEKRTIAALGRLLQGDAATEKGEVPRRLLTREYAGASRTLSGLAEKGIVTVSKRPFYRDLFGGEYLFSEQPERLTDEQESVLAAILPDIGRRQYCACLLHGITGSGKTEVYLRAAAAAIQQSLTVLILVPEIILASHLEAHFLSRFGGERLAVLHSGLTAAERFQQWMRIVNNMVDVVIGARSAVFAPLGNLGLIIVDEEHDSAYKQDSGLRYNARDLAVLRGNCSKVPVILGSATPAVVSYHHAMEGKYRLLLLTKRIDERPLPAVSVVDLRKIQTVSGQPPIFSPDLINGLRENLQKKEQSLVFLNRRGYANFMLCRECGHAVYCPKCHVSLTLHRMRRELACHYCGYTTGSDSRCPQCRTGQLAGFGVGTERIESELARIFPAARIARLDRDTCRKRQDFINILKAVHQGQVDILVGTQMIAKGHHFPNVTLVGLIWADAGLGLPDYKAGERTFQLISQVAGRAGRGAQPGRVVVQTHLPDHYSIQMAKGHNFQGFFEKEISMRREHGFPPFSRLVVFLVEGEKEEKVRETAVELGRKGQEMVPGISVEILGPAPAPLDRLRGKYRWQLLISGRSGKSLHAFCSKLWLEFQGRRKRDGITVFIDVDPESML